jgi:hypothetical protein
MANKRKELKIEAPNLWYLVGLITSDGCLSSDGRHIDITSKGYKFLQGIKDTFGLDNKIGVKYNSIKQKAFHIQIANKNFYDFLLSVGLSQNKSLTVGAVNVPGQYFCDFLRGLIDGDGCIRQWVHSSNQKEQWSLRIYSGSGAFIKWLNNTIESLLKIKGKVYRETDTKWILKYGKMAAREIAKRCYYKNCFGLERKIKLAKECFSSYKGWSKSKTVFN